MSIGTAIGSSSILELAGLSNEEEEGRRIKRRLCWLRLSMMARTVGWAGGIVFAVLPGIAVAIAAAVFSTGQDNAPWFQFFSEWLVEFWLSCGYIWLLLFWGLGVVAPATEFSRRARAIAKVRRPSHGNLTRYLALHVLQTSGALGRLFFRATTGRMLNIGVRPDLTEKASLFASEIMLPVPAEGVDSLSSDRVDRYDQFVRDIAGLLAIGRIDLVNEAKRTRGFGSISESSDSIYENLRSFLQPFAGQSSADAAVRYLVPTVALAVSIIALAVSM